MAKNTIGNITTLPQNGTKQRKKLAKREAKLMLQIEQVNKDCHRIEQKIAKAQSKLDATRTNLHDLEGELTHVRTLLGEPGGQAASETAPPQAESAEAEFAAAAPEHNGADAGANIEDMVEIMHLQAPPPAEGRADVGETPEDVVQNTADAGADIQNEVEIMHLEAAPPAEGRADIGEAPETAEASEDAVESVSTSEANKGAEEDTPPAIVEPTASSTDLEAVAGSTESEATTSAENGEETGGSVEEEAKSPTTKPRTRRRTTSRRQPQSGSGDANPENM